MGGTAQLHTHSLPGRLPKLGDVSPPLCSPLTLTLAPPTTYCEHAVLTTSSAFFWSVCLLQWQLQQSRDVCLPHFLIPDPCSVPRRQMKLSNSLWRERMNGWMGAGNAVIFFSPSTQSPTKMIKGKKYCPHLWESRQLCSKPS